MPKEWQQLQMELGEQGLTGGLLNLAKRITAAPRHEGRVATAREALVARYGEEGYRVAAFLDWLGRGPGPGTEKRVPGLEGVPCHRPGVGPVWDAAIKEVAATSERWWLEAVGGSAPKLVLRRGQGSLKHPHSTDAEGSPVWDDGCIDDPDTLAALLPWIAHATVLRVLENVGQRPRRYRPRLCRGPVEAWMELVAVAQRPRK